MAAHFEPVVNANYRLVAPPPTRRIAIGGYPKVASYDMLGEQLHYSNPVKHSETGTLLQQINDMNHAHVQLLGLKTRKANRLSFFAKQMQTGLLAACLSR